MSKANLANAILAADINDTATTATLVAGYGDGMPPVPFKLTFTPFGQLSTKGNSEIVLVTARSADTLTIVRAKGGTTAKSFEAGDIVSNGVYIENSVAVGDIFMSLRATPDTGRLFMDGGTYNKSDYPLMYKCVQDNAAYGTTGGSSGSETFTLADMCERMPFGKSSNSPFTTLGAKGGTVNETLTVDQIPSHKHRLRVDIGGGDGGYLPRGSTNIRAINVQNMAAEQSQTGTFSDRASGSYYDVEAMESTGGGLSHNNMSPYIIVNYEVIAG